MAAGGDDFYAVLGLARDCSDAELRMAYKKLALRWHPDRCSEKSEEEAKTKFQAIQEAYSVLSDSNKRLMYDIGVYDNSDDDEEGMEDFLGEMAEMMSQNKPSEGRHESFEELQRLFVEMFQADLDAGFGGFTDNGWNCTASSTSNTVPLSYCSHKRGSSAVNSDGEGELDSGTAAFCFGSTDPVREASAKGRMLGGNSSSSKSNKRRNGRKHKVSSSKHNVSSYDNTLVH